MFRHSLTTAYEAGEREGYGRLMEEARGIISDFCDKEQRPTKRQEMCHFETGLFCNHAIGWNDALTHGIKEYALERLTPPDNNKATSN